MDYKIFSSNRSILQSSAIHPIIATADLFSRFEGEGITSAFLTRYYKAMVINLLSSSGISISYLSEGSHTRLKSFDFIGTARCLLIPGLHEYRIPAECWLASGLKIWAGLGYHSSVLCSCSGRRKIIEN